MAHPVLSGFHIWCFCRSLWRLMSSSDVALAWSRNLRPLASVGSHTASVCLKGLSSFISSFRGLLSRYNLTMRWKGRETPFNFFSFVLSDLIFDSSLLPCFYSLVFLLFSFNDFVAEFIISVFICDNFLFQRV